MVEIWLPYGTSEVPVRIPDENLVDILQPQSSGQTSEINLNQLITEEIVTAAKKAGQTCIVVGNSRNEDLIVNATKALVTAFAGAGITSSSLTVLCTPHSPSIDSVLPDAQVFRHSPMRSPTIPFEGFPDFAPSVNKVVAEAPFVIAVGELLPNHFRGFEGLCDTIFPGLASEKSAHDELYRTKPMDPHDLYKERLDIASRLHNVYGFGFVLNSDLSPIEVKLEPFKDTVDRLSETIRNTSTVQATKSAQIVIMSAGGAPFDETLVRAVEAFPAGLSVLKRNGALIVAAECARGHGGSDLYSWLAEKKEARHLESRLRHRFNYDGWKSAFLSRALANHRIYLVSTIPDHHLEHTFGLKPAKTMNAALQSAQRALGIDVSITAIPNASQVIPSLPSAAQQLPHEG